MNQDTLQGQWKQIKGKVQENWGKLTDGEVEEINGKREQLIGKLQEKYGYARERAEEEVEEFCDHC